MNDAPATECFQSRFESLKTWDRWGPEDEAGMLNLVTEDVVMSAIDCVRNGIRISCGRRLKPDRRGVTSDYTHHMHSSGAEVDGGFASMSDWFAMSHHGMHVTHIDSPSHILWNSQMYNGFGGEEVTAKRGAARGAVDLARDGIMTRGHLADVPRFRRVEYVAPNEAVSASELDAMTAHVADWGAGNALVVRFGRDRIPAESWGLSSGGVPGLADDCLEWLKERQVAVLMTDFISDVMPSRIEDCSMPIHVGGIGAMGLWIIDNAELAQLSDASHSLGRTDFALFVSPLNLARATGSPVNPIALF